MKDFEPRKIDEDKVDQELYGIEDETQKDHRELFEASVKTYLLFEKVKDSYERTSVHGKLANGSTFDFPFQEVASIVLKTICQGQFDILGDLGLGEQTRKKATELNKKYGKDPDTK